LDERFEKVFGVETVREFQDLRGFPLRINLFKDVSLIAKTTIGRNIQDIKTNPATTILLMQ
jgi:hypothetical protein